MLTVMENAWIVSADHEVEAVLSCPDLHVRPVDEQVPRAMQGTALGDIYQRLARMNEGERHAQLRQRVDELVGTWDIFLLADLAAEVSASLPRQDVPAFVLATAIGLRDPEMALPLIRDFAAAIAGGASDEAIQRGISAAGQLLDGMSEDLDADDKANLLGFLFQVHPATARLIDARLHGDLTPPVVLTRRWAARDIEICNAQLRRGDKVIVLLTSPKFHFGAGRHACPGRQIAEAIAEGVLRDRRRVEPVPTR